MSRREFTAAVKREIQARSGGVCECHRMTPDIRGLFPLECNRPASDIDHIFADCLEAEGAKSEPLTAEDGAHLCKPCHTIKTSTDQKYRKLRNKTRVRKDRPKSGWFNKSPRKLQSNSQWPQRRKLPKGRKLQSRGFGA